MKILLVEDNPGDILLAQEALKEGVKTPCELIVVNDGEQALKYLFKQSPYEHVTAPDLIFLDLNIPRINGRDVLKKIKNDDFLRVIPVIVFSTSEADYDIRSSYECRANCYVAKPIDFEDFVSVISNIVNYWSSVKMVSKVLA